MIKILALIPARSGSKSIPNKNIRLINKKPLIAYTIDHARKSKLINRVIVSTDSRKYAAIATEYGAEVPFIRPAKYSKDNSTDLEVFTHCLNWLKENENYYPDICVHLRPTHPIRNVKHIDSMIKIMMNNPEIDSVRSVVPSEQIPFKMWSVNKKGFLVPIIKTNIYEAYNMPRQYLPKTYYQNASIDVIKTEVILKNKSMSGRKIFGFKMDVFFDIDNLTELRNVRKELKRK